MLSICIFQIIFPLSFGVPGWDQTKGQKVYIGLYTIGTEQKERQDNMRVMQVLLGVKSVWAQVLEAYVHLQWNMHVHMFQSILVTGK